MGLKEFYYSLEDKYYAFMDKVEEKGVKVYEYFIDPIENNGLPSFPFFCVLLLAFIGALSFIAISIAGGDFFPPATPVTATLSVKVTGEGQLLEGVLVVLDNGTDKLTEKTVEGIAVFKGVPVGKRLSVKVENDGYDTFSGSAFIAKGKVRDFIEVALALRSIGGEIFFAVKDSNGDPVPGATIIYRDSKGNKLSGTTDALGQLPLEFSSRTDVFSVSVVKEGFEEAVSTCIASKDLCEVTLDSKSKVTPSPEERGTVTVKVVNPAGDDVASARVTLRHADTGESLDEDLTDSLGNVKFVNAVTVGTPIYATVKADGFETYETETKSTGQESEFLVSLVKLIVTPGPGPDTSKINLEVIDTAKNPLEGADLRIFVSNKPLRELDQLSTDTEGKASFEASFTTEIFVTVFKEGYLPSRSRALRGGSFELLTLQRVIVGNSGSLKVQVKNEEDQPVEFASVTLLDKDGFYLGVPRKDTLPDGSVTFSGLPLKTIRAIATFESQKGEADLVEIGTEEKTANIRLRPADAFVSAVAKEIGSKSLLNATFTSYKFSDNSKIGSCFANKAACTLTVPAMTKVYLKVVSDGHVSATTEEFEVPADQIIKRESLLLDSSLVSQLRILDARVENALGLNETFVNPGRFYQFRLSFNLPSGLEDAGAYVRIGTKSELADEPAYFVSQSGVTSEITKGARYNPGTSCADDAGSDKNFKWMETRFKEFGSKTVSAKIFVKPTANEKDVLVLQYRIFGKKAGTYLRQPTDATFGEKERTDSLDSCYAKTQVLELPVRQGFSSCNEQACISAAFFDANTSAANGFPVNLDSTFGLLVSVRSFMPLSSPFLDLELDKPLRAIRHVFDSEIDITPPAATVSIPLSFTDEKSGAFGLKAILPSRNAKVKLIFGDASGKIHELSRYVVVKGTGKLTLTANPLSLKTNKDNPLSLTVLSVNNQPIEDAKITLKEKKGAPFDGFPSGAQSLLGDGSENLGKDGVYRFQNLKPTSVGELSVAVTRDGFTDVEKTLTVTADEALEFDRDPSLIELSCTEKNTVQINNKLNSELKVTGTFSGTSCAKIQVIGGGLPTTSTSSITPAPSVSATSPTPSALPPTGTNSISFKIKPGDKAVKLVVTPTSLQAQCVMLLNAETLTGISAGPVQDVWFSATCLAPSPSPPTGDAVCTSVGGVCVQSSGSCPSGFVLSGSSTASVVPSPSGSSTVYTCDIGKYCCVPSNIPSPSPSPSGPPLSSLCPRPDFGQLLAQQALDYNLNNGGQAVAALAAPTVIVIDPVKGIEVVKSTGCTQSGNSVSCEKPLYTLLPTNAMAFSIVNRLGVTTDVLVNPNNKCFDVREVGSSSNILSTILSSQVVNSVQSFAGLQRNQYRTYTITFMPKTGCVEFDGKSLQLAGTAKNGFTMRLESRTVIGGGSAELNFMPKFVQHATDAYSLVAMPASGTVVLRGKDGATFEEPAYFGHNVLSGKLTFTVMGQGMLAAPIPLQYGSLTPATLLLKKTTQAGLGLSVAESSGAKVSDATVTAVPSVVGLDGFDVVGNVQSDGDCSGANYCTPEAAKAYVTKVEGELNDLYDAFTNSLDTVSLDNSLASPQAQQEIARNAANNYGQMLAAYDQCLQQVCNQGGQGGSGGYNQPYGSGGTQQGSAGSTFTPVPGQQSTPARPPECDKISGAIPPGQNPYTSPYGQYGAGGYGGAYPGGYGGYGGQSGYGGYGSAATGYAGGYGNPYSSYGYGYPSGVGYRPGYERAYNDPNLYRYMQNPSFSQSFYNTPYMSGLAGQNPLYRNSFGTNPNFANLNFQQGTEPILKLSHQFVLPVKVAGSEGGILQYKYRTDLNAIGKGKWVSIDTISSVPYAYVAPITTAWAGSSSSSSSGTASRSSVTGGDGKFPYLRLKPGANSNYYELVNWLKGIAAPAAVTTSTSGVPSTTASGRAATATSDAGSSGGTAPASGSQPVSDVASGAGNSGAAPAAPAGAPASGGAPAVPAPAGAPATVSVSSSGLTFQDYSSKVRIQLSSNQFNFGNNEKSSIQFKTFVKETPWYTLQDLFDGIKIQLKTVSPLKTISILLCKRSISFNARFALEKLAGMSCNYYNVLDSFWGTRGNGEWIAKIPYYRPIILNTARAEIRPTVGDNAIPIEAHAPKDKEIQFIIYTPQFKDNKRVEDKLAYMPAKNGDYISVQVAGYKTFDDLFLPVVEVQHTDSYLVSGVPDLSKS